MDEEKTPTNEDLQQENGELKESYLRLQAEFANYKRRNETLSQDSFNKGVQSVFTKLVDILDDFDLALTNKNASAQDFKKGMELIFAKLFSSAEEFGLKKINSVGEQFDPKFHEALLTEFSEKPENQILEELQSGYMLNDVVLRHTKVKVAKNKGE